MSIKQIPETQFLNVKQKIAELALQNGRDPNSITLVAVSKGHSEELISAAYSQGCRDFGESRMQEVLQKISDSPKEIQWHYIGTLQKNKVAKAIGKFALIHSVDSVELALKISQASLALGIKTAILLQVNTSGEKSKHGLSGLEWLRHLEELLSFSGLSIEGLMTIAPLIEEEKKIRSCFSELRKWRDIFVEKSGGKGLFRHLSMGMTHDFQIAIEEGATILRIGTAIFGSRS